DIRPIYYASSFTADPDTGTIYAGNNTSIIVTTDGFDTITPVGPASVPAIASITLGAGAKPGDPVRLYVSTAQSTDAFVAKLDANGAIVWATYLGGSASESARAIAVDSSGNVYVTGNTGSADFPVTKGAYLTVAPSNGTAGASPGGSYLTKLNAAGGIVFSTF